MIRLETCTPALRGFLDEHRIPALNIAGILENEPGVEIFVDDAEKPKGVLVKGPHFWYTHTEDDAFVEALIEEMLRVEEFYDFSAVWKPLADRIMARFPVVWNNSCDLYVLPDDFQIPAGRGAATRSIELPDAEVIDSFYAFRNDRSLEKIRSSIQKRPSSAVYVDGEIVCWLLIHEDNSFGIMYTKEEHRRKGLAEDVTYGLIEKQLAAGRTPFLQIITNNSMSPGLASKCGFVKKGQCDWFGVLVGMPKRLVEHCQGMRRRVLELVGQPRQESTCMCRFIHSLQTGDEPDPIEEIPVQEWLEITARHADRAMLEKAIEAFGDDLVRVGERRNGILHVTAALISNHEGDDHLLWNTSVDGDFLLNLLRHARRREHDLVVAFVKDPERKAFEEQGFIPVYSEP